MGENANLMLIILLSGFAAACPPPLRSAAGATVLPQSAPWRWIAVDRSRALSYTFVPKVMCTSLRTIMNAHMKGRGGCKHARCAEVRTNPGLRKQANLTELTRFVIIRDPFDRLVSAYHNSATNQYIHAGRCTSAQNCSFAEFVQAIAMKARRSGGSLDFNEHFKLQVDIAAFSSMRYHHVFRMTCPRHVECIYRGLLNSSQVHLNRSPQRVATFEKLFTSDVLRTFMSLYRRDVDLWRAAECVGPWCECTPSTADRLLV